MKRKILFRRLLNKHFNNVAFSDFIDLIEAFGFSYLHTKGSHQIYTHPLVEDALNLQPRSGEAKPYQIRQFIELVEIYNLSLKDEN